MCLSVCKIKHPDFRPLIAGYNILCWKVLVSNTIHYRGKLVVTPLSVPLTPYRNERCPVPSTQEAALSFDFDSKDSGWREVGPGIHAYRTKCRGQRVAYGPRHELFPCVIPKGTRFFIGIHGDIVAEKMMVFPKDKVFDVGRAKPSAHKPSVVDI